MVTPQNLNNGVIKKSAAPDVTPLNVINQLGETMWLIVNLADDEEKNLHFSEMNEPEILWAQQLLLSEFPYQDARNTLRYAHGTLKQRIGAIKRVLVYLREQTVDKQQLKNWTMADCVTFVQSIATKEDSLLSYAAVAPVMRAVNESYSLRYQLDAIPFALPETFLPQAMSPLCKAYGMTYSQWERGGSYGMVPMPVATLLLADAINLIRSKQCQLLQCYFTSFREGLITSMMMEGGNKRSKSIFKSDISDFLKPSKINSHTNASAHRKFDMQRADFVKQLHQIDPELSDFPFKSQYQITDFVQEIEGACLTILLAVTAMRLSECHSVGADWMEAIEYLDVNGVWTADAILKSKIIKTGGGIIAKRGLSPMGIEAFELLNSLSWIDKKQFGLKLFAFTYLGPWRNRKNEGDSSTVAISTLRNRLQQYYQKFVERSHESVRAAYPAIIPHSLRHLKMAFALRKFDGNVEEALKQEFRHHGHQTESYSNNKLNEVEDSIVRRDYAQEVINRILINDPNDKWVGPSAKKVRDLAKRLLDGQNIEMLSLVELAEFHEEMHDNIHSMLMHSYGMCFVLKDSINAAKCGVKDSIVKTGSANSKLCNGCANFCVNNKSHEMEMEMNKRRWHATANCELIASFPIVAEAKIMVKKIERLQAELEASDE